MVTSNAAVRRGSLVEPQVPVAKAWQNRLQDHQKHNKADYELCDLWDRSWQGTEPTPLSLGSVWASPVSPARGRLCVPKTSTALMRAQNRLKLMQRSHCYGLPFKSKSWLEAENAVLRQQLIVL